MQYTSDFNCAFREYDVLSLFLFYLVIFLVVCSMSLFCSLIGIFLLSLSLPANVRNIS